MRLLPDSYHPGMRFRVVSGMHANVEGLILSIDFETEVIEIRPDGSRRTVKVALDQVTLVGHDGCDCRAEVANVV